MEEKTAFWALDDMLLLVLGVDYAAHLFCENSPFCNSI